MALDLGSKLPAPSMGRISIMKPILMVVLLCGVGVGVQAQNGKSILLPGESFSPSSDEESILLQSNNALFRFGFRQSSDTQRNSYYLCIWYANLTGHHIVWTANRDGPVSNRSFFVFTARLELQDNDGDALIWTSPPGNQLLLQDSGNLLLTNDTAAILVWQSFDHPTDTLLPTQKLLMGSFLVSRSSIASNELASGSYKLELFSTSASLTSTYLPWTYWNTPVRAPSSSHYVVFDDDETGTLRFHTNTSAPYVAYQPWDWDKNTAQGGVIRRLSLDFDGNLRIYTWNPVSLLWYVAWFAVLNECSIHGICGPYAYCVYTPKPTCLCPQGFEPIDRNKTWLGCSPINTSYPSCSSYPSYIILDQVDYPYNDLLYIANTSLDSCQAICNQNCLYLGFVYGIDARGCWMKKTLKYGVSQSNRRSFLKVYDSIPSSPYSNSYTLWSSPSLPPNTNPAENTTVAPSPTTIQPKRPSANDTHDPPFIATASQVASYKMATILLSTFSSLLIVGCALMLPSYLWRTQAKPVMAGCQKFTYKELEIATNNFIQPLGSGGSCTVFKGRLQDRANMDVAVKKLAGVQQGLEEGQFRAEVTTLRELHHINLVRLIGYCEEGEHKLLVYEFFENGSLDAYLFPTAHSHHAPKKLSWQARLQIIRGIAKALAYLHDDCVQPILHCDIKPANILLDTQFHPKVADFGIARFYSREQTLKVSDLCGTLGYMAPEWFSIASLTNRADVYSFGILLLEIVTGKSNSSAEIQARCGLPIWMYTLRTSGSLHEAMDRNVVEFDHENGYSIAVQGELERVVNVGLWCTQENMRERPSMETVIRMLDGEPNVGNQYAAPFPHRSAHSNRRESMMSLSE